MKERNHNMKEVSEQDMERAWVYQDGITEAKIFYCYRRRKTGI